MKIDARIAAREWILTAIQHHSCIPNKETKREIERLIKRFQRDIKQMRKTRQQMVDGLTKAQWRDVIDRRIRFDHAINK